MAEPTPLPVVELTDIPDPPTRRSLGNVLYFLQRIRDVIFDTSTVDGLGSQLQNLQTRPKDIYTFPIGTPTLTPSDPGYAAVPLDAVSDGTLMECYLKGQKTAKGTVVVQVQVGGAVMATLTVAAGGTSASVTTKFPGGGAIKAKQTIKVVVTSVPDDPGLDDAVVQVMVR